MKNFGIIGAAGFVAPRHMRAIRETGNNLVWAADISDSVGVLDSYFPMAEFNLCREVPASAGMTGGVDYLSVCTPNHLHSEHIRLGLDMGADVICEKPVVLDPEEVDVLGAYQDKTGNKIFNILQLRLHPSIIAFKERIDKGPSDKVYDIDLTYITSRGRWYFSSWKADMVKSGGIATNIGVHFFDMLSWIFGSCSSNIVHLHKPDRAAGFFQLERARVRWFLSVDHNDLPEHIRSRGGRVYRSVKIGDEEIEFSDGFTDLHTRSYEEILAGRGFGVYESKPSIEIVHDIRKVNPIGLLGDYHPLLA